MKKISDAEALNKAAAYCTLCERCISEVKTKLDAWGIEYSSQTKIIDRLIDEKFIDESRYCKAFVNDKLRFNHWGRIKIQAKLREKRLPRELIAAALENIDEEEYCNVLRTLLANKSREVSGDEERKKREKLLRFATSRGFEPSFIMKQMNFYPDEVDF
jgi:regulatory protein